MVDEEVEGAGATLVIVDDVPQNIHVLAGILTQAGHRVRAALSGRSALEIIEQDPPDLILLDVNMPDLDGYDLCRHIKADPALCDIPVIFLTARSEEEDITRGFDLGAVDFVSKPFHPAELMARVRTHLALRLAFKELQASLTNERALRQELVEALTQVKKLSGLLPICAKCKKIRDDKGYWTQLEQYLRLHSEAEFSHGICPHCAEELYPEVIAWRQAQAEQ